MIIYNKKINEIKNAHKEHITNFRYYLFQNNFKKDLILSISALDNNVKLWNIANLECICNIKNVNKNGLLLSACCLNNNNQHYIITSNDNLYFSEYIKVFDFQGNKIKEIDDFNFNTFYIDSYYDKKNSVTYIVTSNFGYVKSYDFNKSKIYHKYFYEDDNGRHFNIIINELEEIIELIESSNEGIIRIWNFHSGELFYIIKDSISSLICICLWDKDTIIVGSRDRTIKIIDLNKKKVTDSIFSQGYILTIKKIVHPHYGECLISQGYENEQIKLWEIKN